MPRMAARGGGGRRKSLYCKGPRNSPPGFGRPTLGVGQAGGAEPHGFTRIPSRVRVVNATDRSRIGPIVRFEGENHRDFRDRSEIPFGNEPQKLRKTGV